MMRSQAIRQSKIAEKPGAIVQERILQADQLVFANVNGHSRKRKGGHRLAEITRGGNFWGQFVGQ